MTLKVIGINNCSRCDMVESILNNNNIKFNYRKLEECDEPERRYYRKLAIESKQLEMPLIIKDGKVVAIKEVI